MANQKPKILFLGPLPPPFHGVSVANQILLNSELITLYDVTTINTAKGKKFTDLEKVNFRNLWIALQSLALCIYHLFTFSNQLMYVQISQNRNAFLRDFLFITVAKCFRIPLLFHLHGGAFRLFYEQSAPWMKRIIRWSLRDCKGMIVLGHSLKPIFNGLVPSSRIYVVENGIDVAGALSPPAPDLFSDQIHVTYLGNLIEDKGVKDIIYAAPQLVARHPNICFDFIGTVYRQKQFEEWTLFIDQHGLTKHFRFHGLLTGPEKEAVLAKGAIFCFPSRYFFEGQPFVILEAMAHRLPVITTGIGAIPEMVKHHWNGIVIEPGDQHQLIEAVSLLVSQPDLRKQLGLNGNESYLSYYTAGHFTSRFIEVVNHIFKEIG